MHGDIRLVADDETLRTKFLALKEPRNLATLLEVPYSYLTYLLYRSDPSHRYREFTIRKRRGGIRTIRAPSTSLRILQSKLNQVLQAVYSPRDSVHGFVRNRGILSNAELHVGKRYVLNVDLEDFFPSINFGRVRGLFMAKPYEVPSAVASVLAQICCFDDQLPQGAPTSPVVSNMICSKLDAELQRLARTHRCMYSRYVDDITVSTSVEPFPSELGILESSGEVLVARIGHELLATIVENGFRVNPNKVRLQRRSWHQEVTGLTVNEFPNVRRRVVRQIRAMLHAWQKYGLDAAAKDHAEKYRSPDKARTERVPAFQDVVRGKVEFLRMVKGAGDVVYEGYASRLRGLDPTYRPGEEIEVPDPTSGTKDVFICHASEDKRTVVEPLRRALQAAAVTYWYDRAEIKWGHTLVQKINEGLRDSRYVLVILSRHFLRKKWTTAELSAALHLEIDSGETKVLALLADSEENRQQILKQLPLLAKKRYLTWEGSPAAVVAELKTLLKP